LLKNSYWGVKNLAAARTGKERERQGKGEAIAASHCTWVGNLYS